MTVHGTPVVADALRGPGTPLSGGLVVPPGAAVIGPVFPRGLPYEAGLPNSGRGSAGALLLVRGDADAVIVDLLRQAAEIGLTAYGQLHINPDPPEALADRRVSITPTGLPPGKSPLCASVSTPVVVGYRCYGGATASPSGPGMGIDIMQGDCTRVKCPSPAPALALVTVCCGASTQSPVPFPPVGWNLAEPSGVDPPPTRMSLPRFVSRPGDGLRIALPRGVHALAPTFCTGGDDCFGDLLVLRTEDGKAALRELVRGTAGGPYWEQTNQHRFRTGRWSGLWVAVASFDHSVGYTLYDSRDAGPDYLVVYRYDTG